MESMFLLAVSSVSKSKIRNTLVKRNQFDYILCIISLVTYYVCEL